MAYSIASSEIKTREMDEVDEETPLKVNIDSESEKAEWQPV